MTFNIVNICVQKIILKFCAMCEKCKIVMHAKISGLRVDVSQKMFFYS